jgi:hypothetical protein
MTQDYICPTHPVGKPHCGLDSQHKEEIVVNSIPFPSSSEYHPVFPHGPEDNLVAIAYVNSDFVFYRLADEF